MNLFVGLIACEDRPGLIHQITGVLIRHKMNIIKNEEFVDRESRRFFMRLEFEGDAHETELRTELKKVLPNMSFCEVKSFKKPRLVVFVSKELHCLGELLLRSSINEMNAELLAVVSQVEDGRDLARRFDVPFHCVPVSKDRREHEERILQLIEPMNADYLVLARYMRIFTAEFVSHFPDRMINIHHSFLPAFIGKDPYQQAHERGVKIIGATAHLVTEDLDEGPIIEQDVITVDHTCSSAEMARRGQDIERLVLARAVNLVISERVLVDGNKTVVFR